MSFLGASHLPLKLKVVVNKNTLYDSEVSATFKGAPIAGSFKLNRILGQASQLNFSLAAPFGFPIDFYNIIECFGGYGDDYADNLLFYGLIPGTGLTAEYAELKVKAFGMISLARYDKMRCDDEVNLDGNTIAGAIEAIYHGNGTHAENAMVTWLNTNGYPFSARGMSMKDAIYLTSISDQASDPIRVGNWPVRLDVLTAVMKEAVAFSASWVRPLRYNLVETGYGLDLIREEADKPVALTLSAANCNMDGDPNWEPDTEGYFNCVDVIGADPQTYARAGPVNDEPPAAKNIPDSSLKTTDACKTRAEYELKDILEGGPFSVTVMSTEGIGISVGDYVRVIDTVHGKDETLLCQEWTLTEGGVELKLGRRPEEFSKTIARLISGA